MTSTSSSPPLNQPNSISSKSNNGSHSASSPKHERSQKKRPLLSKSPALSLSSNGTTTAISEASPATLRNQDSSASNGSSTTATTTVTKQPTTSTNGGNAAAAPSSPPATTTPSKKIKRRRQSAFRIKVGCLVALRYRSTGNTVYYNNNNNNSDEKKEGVENGEPILQQQQSPSLTKNTTVMVDTWVDPTPGVDESYLLMGRRVRCCFPKSVLRNEETVRIVEGEIVGLVLQEGAKHNNNKGYIPVELLIDDSAMQPFLERVDQDVDVSKLSDKDRKRHKYEEIIKGGKNKIIVRVNLAFTATTTTGAGLKKGGEGDAERRPKEDETALVCKWVLRKRVESGSSSSITAAATSAIMNGDENNGKNHNTEGMKQVTKQYVGNKHDSDSQQEQNWRWLARGKAARFNYTNTDGSIENLFLGEVLDMTPKAQGKTLAMVTLKEIGLSIHTPRGQTERRQNDSGSLLMDLKNPRQFQVPIEELVIVSRKILRGEAAAAASNNNGEAFAVIHRVYSLENNSWTIPPKSDVKDKEALEVASLSCHRCGVEGMNMFKDHLACTPLAISCSDCLSQAKVFGKSGTYLKSCRCQQCRQYHGEALNRAFDRSTTSIGATSNGPDCEPPEQECNTCCLRCKSGFSCKTCGVMIHKRCAKWMRLVSADEENQEHCRVCRASIAEKKGENVEAPIDDDMFAPAISRVKETRFSDFELPSSYAKLYAAQASSDKPITAIKPRGNTGPRKTTGNNRTVQKKRPRAPTVTKSGTGRNGSKKQKDRGNDVHANGGVRAVKFKPRCSRLLPYDPIQRRFEGISKHQIASFSSRSQDANNYKDVIRNLRGTIQKQEEKLTANRAARANQRRLMKDVVAFGSTSLSLDALAGRESHLRFDRSGIHAWGVFADQDIREGELIVEYRGVIIGNAVAEKREKEYEQAKIGSDYMFRIDANSVCDATKHGNVARFINASCDPNCYTQIISINGVKRIVIYAKADIQAGQELCYDYKFPLEYDVEKRIPCYCGTKDCRGFMNWDKRYIALPLPDAGAPRQASQALKSAAHSGPSAVATALPVSTSLTGAK